MLGDKDASPTIGVKSLDAARSFYEGKLGLKRIRPEAQGVLLYKSGSSTIMVYESQYAGTNKATAVTWTAGEDLDGLVKALRDKGVSFEKYDLPGTTREGDVHVTGDMRLAWFKDPDGNIHALASR